MACRLDNLNQCWNIVNRTLRNIFQWNLYRISNIFINKNALKMSSAKWRPFCLGLNVLKPIVPDTRTWCSLWYSLGKVKGTLELFLRTMRFLFWNATFLPTILLEISDTDNGQPYSEYVHFHALQPLDVTFTLKFIEFIHCCNNLLGAFGNIPHIIKVTTIGTITYLYL